MKARMIQTAAEMAPAARVLRIIPGILTKIRWEIRLTIQTAVIRRRRMILTRIRILAKSLILILI